MIENRICPYCGKFVEKNGDYARGKQGIKQYFHFVCMLDAKSEIKNDKNDPDVRSDTSDSDKLRS